jgi:hypothetical protein
MPRPAWRENRLARQRRELAPNSGLVTHSKDAQKVTPWKNYLAETKPFIGIIARHGVSPCQGTLEHAVQPSNHTSSPANGKPHRNLKSATDLCADHAAVFVPRAS